MAGKWRLFRGLKAFTQGFLIGVPVCLTFTDNFFTVCQVEGVSMQPVLNCDGKRRDFVLISRWKAKKFNKIERGDIVSIISPKDPDTVFIKRVIALEGDTVRTLSYKNRNIRIPRGHCWIEGDNHEHSLDSNAFGSVPIGLVNGVATRIVWPPSRWGKLSTQIPVGRRPSDHTSELENKESGFLVGEDSIGKGDSSRINLTDDKEPNSDIDIPTDSLPIGFHKEKVSSSNLLTHLPQNALRHASDVDNVNANEE